MWLVARLARCAGVGDAWLIGDSALYDYAMGVDASIPHPDFLFHPGLAHEIHKPFNPRFASTIARLTERQCDMNLVSLLCAISSRI